MRNVPHKIDPIQPDSVLIDSGLRVLESQVQKMDVGWEFWTRESKNGQKVMIFAGSIAGREYFGPASKKLPKRP